MCDSIVDYRDGKGVFVRAPRAALRGRHSITPLVGLSIDILGTDSVLVP